MIEKEPDLSGSFSFQTRGIDFGRMVTKKWQQYRQNREIHPS
jgi:hypothetical protein